MSEGIEKTWRKSVEVDIHDLVGRLSGLEASYNNIKGDVDEIRETQTMILSEVRSAAKTPWSTLGTWAVVVLMAAGLIGGLVSYGLNSKIDMTTIMMSSGINRVERRLEDHEKMPAHPLALKDMGVVQQRLSDLSKETERLDVMLQREMRLLDARMQMEMRLLIKAVTERIDSMEKNIEKVGGQ